MLFNLKSWFKLLKPNDQSSIFSLSAHGLLSESSGVESWKWFWVDVRVWGCRRWNSGSIRKRSGFWKTEKQSLERDREKSTFHQQFNSSDLIGLSKLYLIQILFAIIHMNFGAEIMSNSNRCHSILNLNWCLVWDFRVFGFHVWDVYEDYCHFESLSMWRK